VEEKNLILKMRGEVVDPAEIPVGRGLVLWIRKNSVGEAEALRSGNTP